jgi:hypothetical protein
MCLFTDYIAFYVLYYINWDWLLFLGLVEVIFFTGVSSIVLYFTVQQASGNLTTNERINWKRYKYLQDDRGRFYNAFDRGLRRNFLEFFHLQRPTLETEVEFLNVSVV